VRQCGELRNLMALASLTRAAALLSVLLLLAVGALEAAHGEEEDCAPHECAVCAATSLTPLAGAGSAPRSRPTAACCLPPGAQGQRLCAPYRDCLPSRAPPLPA